MVMSPDEERRQHDASAVRGWASSEFRPRHAERDERLDPIEKSSVWIEPGPDDDTAQMLEAELVADGR